MKRKICSLLSLILLVTTLINPLALHANEIEATNLSLYVNNNYIEVDHGPFWEGENLWIPFRGTIEGLGGQIVWNNETKTTFGFANNVLFNFDTNKSLVTLTIDGQRYTIYVEHIVKNGRIFVTPEFFFLLDLEIYLDDTSNAIHILSPSQGFMWEVSNGRNTVYLVGSIHVGNNSLYPLRDELEIAFDKSDYLVVEVDLLNQSETINEYILSKSFYTDGTTLKDHISPELYLEITEFLKDFGIDMEEVNIFKPWYLTELLKVFSTMKYYLELYNLEDIESLEDFEFDEDLEYFEELPDYDTELGIDLYFLFRAFGEKEVLELEGYAYQVNLFDSYSIEFQEAQLAASLKVSEPNFELMELMMTAWRTGDAELLESILLSREASYEEDHLYEEFMNKLFTVRNVEMTYKIESYLNSFESNTYFVVVGAGHLVGEGSIVDLLEQKGYKVERR